MEHMILHNFNKSTFLRTYLQILSKHFDVHHHHIITNTTDQHDVNATYDKTLVNFSTVVKPSTTIKRPILYFIHSLPIRKIMKQSDLIIAHGFTDIWYYCLSPSTLKKTVWVIWCYDLYDYRTRKNSLYSRIFFQIKKYLYKDDFTRGTTLIYRINLSLMIIKHHLLNSKTCIFIIYHSLVSTNH